MTVHRAIRDSAAEVLRDGKSRALETINTRVEKRETTLNAKCFMEPDARRPY